MNISELFGTLQQSVVGNWRKHLKTSKYSDHMALDEFYKEMPEKVDKLIEDWMGVNGKKVEDYKNVLPEKEYDVLDYLKELKEITVEGRKLLNGVPELESDMDDVAGLIDSTMYKIKELSENKKFTNIKDYLTEAFK